MCGDLKREVVWCGVLNVLLDYALLSRERVKRTQVSARYKALCPVSLRQTAGAPCCPATRSYTRDRAAALRATCSHGRASTGGSQKLARPRVRAAPAGDASRRGADVTI